MPPKLSKFEEGGPNDPNVTFRGLSSTLVLVKEELSPWGWRAYTTEFAERKEADRKLKALNALPDSGAEPKDGVIEGTPLWQERLDKMLLVEYLKKKLMKAHGYFGDATELMLKCHAWLVKDPLLADTFVNAICHVPASQYDRIDLLQQRLEQSRKDCKFAREYHEDYLVTLQREREEYVMKVIKNQQIRLEMQMRDDVVVSWAFTTQRNQSIKLLQIQESMEVRGMQLQSGFAALTEQYHETARQSGEALDAMTADRDKFKANYHRMVKAHEQAKADLERTKGTAEGQANLIMVLTQEKAMLTQQVEELEDDKRRMTRQLAELRDEVAKLKNEIRRLGAQMRDTEFVLHDVRQECVRLLEVEQELTCRLDETVTNSSRLRDDLEVSRVEHRAAQGWLNDANAELAFQGKIRSGLEAERDDLLERSRGYEEEVIQCITKCKGAIEKTIEKTAYELDQFKRKELAKILADFRKKTDAIMRRNEFLEKEVALGDAVAKDIGGLAALPFDQSKLCSICQRFIVYEGTAEL